MISTDIRRAGPYTATGSQTDFAFSFKVFAAGDLRVVQTSSLGVESDAILGTDYSVTLNPDQDTEPGGEVVFSTAPDDGFISILSDLDTEQPAVFTNTGNFYPRVLNDSLDRATIGIQQLEEEMDRALLAPVKVLATSRYPYLRDDGTWAFGSGTADQAQAYENAFTATAGQVSFTLAFTPLVGVFVYLNGVRLSRTDFEVNGTTLTLFDACDAGDEVVAVVGEPAGTVHAAPYTAPRLTDDAFGGQPTPGFDNSTALTSFVTYLGEAGLKGEIPAGEFQHASALVWPDGPLPWALEGDGSGQTVLSYIGANTTANLITLGDGTSDVVNCRLKGFRVASETLMTSGNALRLRRLCRSILDDVMIDGQDGNGNLWDGIWFDGLDEVRYENFEACAQQNAVKASGLIGSLPKAGLFMDRYKISGSEYGVRIGGALGGVYFGEGDIIDHGDCVVIDNSLVAEVNREVFFSQQCSLDTATRCNVLIDQALAGNGVISFPSQTWIASSGTKGIWIKNANGMNILIDAYFFNHAGDAIRIDDAAAKVEVLSPQFNAITGYCVNPTVAAPLLKQSNPRFIGGCPQPFNFTSNRVVSNVSWPLSIQNQRAFGIREYQGTLDGSGNATIAHGVDATWYKQIMQVFASQKTATPAWAAIIATVDATNINLTGGSAGLKYNVTVLFADTAHTGW